MKKIKFTFHGFTFIHEVADRPEVWFALKDRRGIWKECLYKNGMVYVYGTDSDYLEDICEVESEEMCEVSLA